MTVVMVQIHSITRQYNHIITYQVHVKRNILYGDMVETCYRWWCPRFWEFPAEVDLSSSLCTIFRSHYNDHSCVIHEPPAYPAPLFATYRGITVAVSIEGHYNVTPAPINAPTSLTSLGMLFLPRQWQHGVAGQPTFFPKRALSMH